MTQLAARPAWASMRPRPGGRGEPCVPPTLDAGDDGFNAATTRRPWRTASRGAADDDARGFNAATTRRPWRTRQGASPGRPATDASMRPRPEGRGERPACRKIDRDARRLQCGHDPKAVENAMRAVVRARLTAELQCGHDPKAVENRSRCKRCISRWLERAVRAGGGIDGRKKQSNAGRHSATPVQR